MSTLNLKFFEIFEKWRSKNNLFCSNSSQFMIQWQQAYHNRMTTLRLMFHDGMLGKSVCGSALREKKGICKKKGQIFVLETHLRVLRIIPPLLRTTCRGEVRNGELYDYYFRVNRTWFLCNSQDFLVEYEVV